MPSATGGGSPGDVETDPQTPTPVGTVGAPASQLASRWVIPGLAAVAAADLCEGGDELDAGDPLDLLEAELDLVAEAQRGAVAVGERLAVHVVGEHGERVARLLDGVGVVVEAPVRAVAERVEDDPPGLGAGPHQLQDRRHRHAAHFATRDHPWMQKCWVICPW
jgi:hypothetical protein